MFAHARMHAMYGPLSSLQQVNSGVKPHVSGNGTHAAVQLLVYALVNSG